LFCQLSMFHCSHHPVIHVPINRDKHQSIHMAGLWYCTNMISIKYPLSILIYMHIRISSCLPLYIYVYVCMCICVYVYMCICVYVYVYMYMNMYVSTCIHIYICIYIWERQLQCLQTWRVEPPRSSWLLPSPLVLRRAACRGDGEQNKAWQMSNNFGWYLVAHPTARKWDITPVIYMG
jgi:hypothetical protein